MFGNVKLTADKLHRMATDWPEFQVFVQETDVVAGREITSNAFRHMFSPAGKRQVKIKKTELRRQTERFIMALMQETLKAIANKESIDTLAARAARSELRQGLTNPGNHEFSWAAHFQSTQDEDTETAVDWVLRRSTTNKAKDADYDFFNATEAEIAEAKAKARADVVINLRNALVHVIRNGAMDVCDVNTLVYLNRHAGPKNSPRRWFGTNGLADQFYGGTAMGGALQRYVAGRAQQLSALAQRNPLYWYDIACFQLAGNVIAHGFADGNGRSARALFACTQIQKGLKFVAPLYRWTTNQVTGQNVNQVIMPNQPAIDAYTEQLMDQMV